MEQQIFYFHYKKKIAMGRRRRRQRVDDHDDSLERGFHTKRLKLEGDGASPDSKMGEENTKNADDIERMRERKRLKKLRQKEKKRAAEEEKKKLVALRDEQRNRRMKEKEQRKKQQEIEQRLSADTDNFVKTSMGVKYMDVLVGKGPMLVDRKRIVCKYILRANNKKGKLLDSGERFAFRVGKGEVIKGWDIGLKGMRQGGRRHIIVPPKAGYGNKDIGGGKGAILYFEVTLIQC